MEKGTARLMAEVTGDLRTTLLESAGFLEGMKPLTLKDAHHYRRICDYLEALTVRTLGALSSVSFTGSTAKRARFDAGPGSVVAHRLAESVAYLRETACELLARDDLSPYDGTGSVAALGLLRSLHGALVRSVRESALEDLIRASSGDLVTFLAAADAVAEKTH